MLLPLSYSLIEQYNQNEVEFLQGNSTICCFWTRSTLLGIAFGLRRPGLQFY